MTLGVRRNWAKVVLKYWGPTRRRADRGSVGAVVQRLGLYVVPQDLLGPRQAATWAAGPPGLDSWHWGPRRL